MRTLILNALLNFLAGLFFALNVFYTTLLSLADFIVVANMGLSFIFFIAFGINLIDMSIKRKMKDWCVYIIECSDGTLYTGITNDIVKRILKHNRGKASKYTRSRFPVVLKVVKGGLTRSEAAKLEYKVKQQPKNEKIRFLSANHQ